MKKIWTIVQLFDFTPGPNLWFHTTLRLEEVKRSIVPLLHNIVHQQSTRKNSKHGHMLSKNVQKFKVTFLRFYSYFAPSPGRHSLTVIEKKTQSSHLGLSEESGGAFSKPNCSCGRQLVSHTQHEIKYTTVWKHFMQTHKMPIFSLLHRVSVREAHPWSSGF